MKDEANGADLIPPSAFRLPPSAFLLPPSAFLLPPSASRLPPSSFRLPPPAFRLPPSAFILLVTEGLTERFPRLAEGDFHTGMRLITPDDAIHVGADAAYQVARRLRYWRRITWAHHVPVIHWFTRSVYAWIASHRRRAALL